MNKWWPSILTVSGSKFLSCRVSPSDGCSTPMESSVRGQVTSMQGELLELWPLFVISGGPDGGVSLFLKNSSFPCWCNWKERKTAAFVA